MADPDKIYQDALNQIQGVALPDIEKMKLHLQTLVQQGLITPEQAQAALLDKNAYNDIVTNPAYAAAQERALGQLQQIGEEGGLTAIDRSKVQDIQDQLNTTERGRQEALMMNARERGVGGSGLEMAARLQSEQSAADRASRQGLDVAAMAQQRALDAIQGAGQMAGRMEQDDWAGQAEKARSQNAIDAANADVLNQFAVFNAQQRAAAQAQNLAEKQRVADENVNIKNTEQANNADLYQKDFQNRLSKAQGAAGVLNNWAGAEAQEKAQKTGFKNAITAGLIQTGANALSRGMSAGAFQGAGGGVSAPANYSPNIAANQYARLGYAHGGKVPCMDEGGMVPGEAEVEGDSELNDKVPANLSPGEVVVPRTMVDEPEMVPDFIRSLKHTPINVSAEDIAKVLEALATLKSE